MFAIIAAKVHMAKKKKTEPDFPFRQAFVDKTEWLAQVLPLRIGGHRGIPLFMETLPDAMRNLVKQALSDAKNSDWTLLPHLMCALMAFCELKEQTGKEDLKLACRLCDMAAAQHLEQHAVFGDDGWDRLTLHGNGLARPAIERFCRRERSEAVSAYRKTRDRRIGMSALGFGACLFVSAFFGPYGENGADQYVAEIPRRMCPVCGRTAWPAPEPRARHEQGRRFFCPFCGHCYGWQGPAMKIRNPDGTRRNSTQWTADRMGIDRCQICGRKADETRQGYLSSHHLAPIAEGGEDVPSNIIVLCWDCHKAIHDKKGMAPPKKDRTKKTGQEKTCPSSGSEKKPDEK